MRRPAKVDIIWAHRQFPKAAVDSCQLRERPKPVESGMKALDCPPGSSPQRRECRRGGPTIPRGRRSVAPGSRVDKPSLPSGAKLTAVNFRRFGWRASGRECRRGGVASQSSKPSRPSLRSVRVSALRRQGRGARPGACRALTAVDLRAAERSRGGSDRGDQPISAAKRRAMVPSPAACAAFTERAYSAATASWLAEESARPVSFSSVSDSSCRVASRSLTASSMPSTSAQRFRVP